MDGSIFDASGSPLTVSKDIQIKMYDAASGGTLLWTSSTYNTSVASGKFTINLDASSGSPSLVDRIGERTASQAVYFQIDVDTGPANGSMDTAIAVLPRIRAKGTAFALNAANADSIKGVTATTAEMNRLAGVTASIQTQINALKSSSSGSNYFGSGSDGAAIIAGVTAVGDSTNDNDFVIMNYSSLTINSGATLTTQARKRALLVYVQGDCTINGTLTMSGKGASASATAISLYKVPASSASTFSSESNQTNGSAVNYPTSAAGAGGGSAGSAGANGSGGAAIAGSAGSGGQTGGGGGGGGSGGNGASFGGGAGSAGAAGTAYSGGAGGGGAGGAGNGAVGVAGSAGAVNGGAGGAGGAGQVAGGYTGGNGGGGSGSTAGSAGSGGLGGASGGTGAGGVLYLVVGGNLTIGASGVISANGIAGGSGGGGSGVYGGGGGGGGGSGGGALVVLYAGSLSNSGTIQASGGAAGAGGTGSSTYLGGSGGAGGAGTVTGPTQIVH